MRQLHAQAAKPIRNHNGIPHKRRRTHIIAEHHESLAFERHNGKIYIIQASPSRKGAVSRKTNKDTQRPCQGTLADIRIQRIHTHNAQSTISLLLFGVLLSLLIVVLQFADGLQRPEFTFLRSGLGHFLQPRVLQTLLRS